MINTPHLCDMSVDEIIATKWKIAATKPLTIQGLSGRFGGLFNVVNIS